MFSHSLQSFVLLLLLGTSSVALCQNNNNSEFRFPTIKNETEKCVRDENICEQLEKLRIAHEKKEHEEMISRAEEALKLSEELEKSIAANPQLNDRDREKLQSFEKLVRKIRSELGAKDVDEEKNSSEDDESDPTDEVGEPARPVDVVSGFKVLRQSTIKLVEEIRKTTRFSISAAAINTSNALLKLTRVLRFWR